MNLLAILAFKTTQYSNSMFGSQIKPAAHTCARLKDFLSTYFKVFIMTSLFIFRHSQAAQAPAYFATQLATHAHFDFQNVKNANTSWGLV
jgi:hypothetical protein